MTRINKITVEICMVGDDIWKIYTNILYKVYIFINVLDIYKIFILNMLNIS
jgi:hypothetical protein